MRAFVLKIKEFLKLSKQGTPDIFDLTKLELCIPIYQREYKWTDDKINTLIEDVRRQPKFLGNIILDEKQKCYEIADGQQRITTCYLILVYLYNYYQGSELEQASIKSFLKPYNDMFVLKNETLGEYLHENGSLISLQIDTESDIYYQKQDFERAYNTIGNVLSGFASSEDARDFKEKLLNSEILVLISDQETSTPIEQIFLDINEKAQLLDVEDIFKGHCFEIFVPEFHEKLRDQWVNLKRCAAAFYPLGIDSLGEYIYLFLLEHDSSNLPKRLNIAGRHYLEGKTMDDAYSLLNEMITYGNNIVQFRSDLKKTDYRFVNICADSYEHRNTEDHIALKAMSTEILESTKAVYQKLPFMYWIYKAMEDSALQAEMRHDDLRRIITNLYIYAVLFSLSGEKKSKSIIDHSIRNAIRSSEQRVSGIVSAAKELRKTQMESYSVNPNAKFDELASIYSITDNYKANKNWIPLIYSRATQYNLEHFVIPDLRSAKVKWNAQGQKFDIPIDQTLVRPNKNTTYNYLVMYEPLNEALNNYDIVTKIDMIEKWYSARNTAVPAHIKTVIQHIKEMDSYRRLRIYWETDVGKDIVLPAYATFVQEFFSEEKKIDLLDKLQQLFSQAFQN